VSLLILTFSPLPRILSPFSKPVSYLPSFHWKHSDRLTRAISRFNGVRQRYWGCKPRPAKKNHHTRARQWHQKLLYYGNCLMVLKKGICQVRITDGRHHTKASYSNIDELSRITHKFSQIFSRRESTQVSVRTYFPDLHQYRSV